MNKPRPATARAAKPKARRSAAKSVTAEAASDAEQRLREVMKAKLRDRPALGNLKVGRQTLDRFLASRIPLRLDHIELIAQRLGTTMAILVAEALGGGTLIAKVKLNEELIPAMKLWQAEVERWRSGIPPSPQEDAMLQGEEEQDEATVIRMLLDCINRQHLAGTIAAALAAVAWCSKEKPAKEAQ